MKKALKDCILIIVKVANNLRSALNLKVLLRSCLVIFNFNEAPALAAEAPASYPAEALELAVITPPMAPNLVLYRNTKHLPQFNCDSILNNRLFAWYHLA